MDGSTGENQYLVNNVEVIVEAVRQKRRAAFLFQPLRAGNQLHHPLYLTGPFKQIGGGLVGLALQGIGKTGGNEGRLSGREFCGPGVEKPLGGSFGTKDATAHLSHIKVHFQDAFFSPYHLNKECEISLKPLPYPTSAREEEHIFGGLLGDGAGTAEFFPFPVGIHGFLYLHPVEPFVGEEPGVFAGHYSHCQVRGDFFHWPPPLVGMVC